MAAPGTQPHTRLGRYELLARLATGGMGEIFLARLEGAAGFEKLFVVKRILPHLADDERFREMLISEARIASRLSHANICQVYELGDEAGQLYIVMEYLDGVSLLPLLRKASKTNAKLDFGFIAGVIAQTCDALHYAHELRERNGETMGLVHRDVTPANIFLTESGVAKLLDFGIAKAKGASANTQTGAVKGKYAYMAPEQLRGGEIDRRVDVFALGVVLYEMLALRRLFQRATDYLTFRAVMEQPIPDIRRFRPDEPDALAGALARALDRAPANRFDTARQLASAVLDAAASVSVRPWTQGEISDYVRGKFSTDLSRRSQQVAQAIHRDVGPAASGAPAMGRTTMPLLVHADDETRDDIDDDEGFPSVDTEIDGAAEGGTVTNVGEFHVSSTPPPFASPGDSTTSGQSLQALQPLPAMTQPQLGAVTIAAAALQPRRSLVWPLVALAMVCVAAGALYLVWKTTQQPPTQVVINSSPRTDVQVPVVAVDAGVAGTPAVHGAADAGTVAVVAPDAAATVPVPVGPHNTGPRPPAQLGPYDRVLAASRNDINQCLQDHPDGVVPQSAQLHIAIDGHPKSVTLHPDGLNSSPLGACIRNILSGARFPAAKDEVDMSFPFKARST
jgi:serine/threonine-protein kinase